MTLFKDINMNEDIRIWLMAWASVYVSASDVVLGLRIAVLMVSFAYSGFRLWDYINKRNN